MSDERLKKLQGTDPLKARHLNPETVDEQRPSLAVTFQTLGGGPETLTESIEGTPVSLTKSLTDAFRRIDELERAYRILADAVTDSIIGDPNDWDGDDSELYLLCEYLKNARDIARHEAAEELREKGRTTDSNIPFRVLAEDLDPYQRGAEGMWFRKSDGTVVSWPIVRD